MTQLLTMAHFAGNQGLLTKTLLFLNIQIIFLVIINGIYRNLWNLIIVPNTMQSRIKYLWASIYLVEDLTKEVNIILIKE